jgi:hypothetical protein
MRWSWPGQVGEAAVLEFARYQFLFVISAALGLVNQLSTIAVCSATSSRSVD